MRHRDSIKAKYGVDLFFPRGNVHGLHQDMVLKGGVSSIFSARKEIARVLHTWSEEYSGFKARDARRKRDMRVNCVDDVKRSCPSLEPRSTNVKKAVSNNVFAMLDVDVDVDVTQVSDSKVVKKVPKKAVSTVPVLTGWAAIAAKPAAPVRSVATAVATDAVDDVVDDVVDDATIMWRRNYVTANYAALYEYQTLSWGDFADECGDW